MMLWPWRIMLMIATIWAGAYALISLTYEPEQLQRLAEETVHDSLQLGVTIFLGAELVYYLYLSASLRQNREWGMIVWVLGLLAMLLNMRFTF